MTVTVNGKAVEVPDGAMASAAVVMAGVTAFRRSSSGEPRGPRTELRLSPQQTITDVEAGGLKLVKLVEVPPYHYGARFGKAKPV